MPADDFTETKLAWLDQMAFNHTLLPSAFRCAYVIGTFINRGKREAWPSQETLARILGVSVRAVVKAVRELVAAGYLEEIHSHGRGLTTRYRMLKPERQFNFSDHKTRTAGSKNPNPSSKKPEPQFRQNSLNEQSEEPSDFSRRGKKSDTSSIPKTWPSEEDKKWAEKELQEHGRPDLAQHVDDLAAQCRDYHRSKGTRSADWSATWRTWVRAAPGFNRAPAGRGRTGGLSAAEGVYAAMNGGQFDEE